MSASKVPLPAPPDDDRRFINVKVSSAIYAAARAEMTKKNVTVGQVLDWGLLSYLIETNPEEAKKLGLKP